MESGCDVTHAAGPLQVWERSWQVAVWERIQAAGQRAGWASSVSPKASLDWRAASRTSPGRPRGASSPSGRWPAGRELTVIPVLALFATRHPACSWGHTLMSSDRTTSYWLWRFLSSGSFSADSRKHSMSVSADSAPSCDWHLSTAWEARR